VEGKKKSDNRLKTTGIRPDTKERESGHQENLFIYDLILTIDYCKFIRVIREIGGYDYFIVSLCLRG